MKAKILLIISLALSGCLGGEDWSLGDGADPHGCNGLDGYIWCEGNNRCIRPWDEVCVYGQPNMSAPSRQTLAYPASLNNASTASDGLRTRLQDESEEPGRKTSQNRMPTATAGPARTIPAHAPNPSGRGGFGSRPGLYIAGNRNSSILG
jgi:hypothetical protein